MSLRKFNYRLDSTIRELRLLMRDVLRPGWGETWEESLVERYPLIVAKDLHQSRTGVETTGDILSHSTFENLYPIFLSEWTLFAPIFRFVQGDEAENKRLLKGYFNDLLGGFSLTERGSALPNPGMRCAWVACDEVCIQIQSWRRIVSGDHCITSPKFDQVWALQEATYLANLIHQLVLELTEEQNRLLGSLSQSDALPIDWIESDLLATRFKEVHSGVREVLSDQLVAKLDELLPGQYPSFILEGERGGGKTTTLKRLALYLAHQYLYEKQPRLPVYIPLIEYGLMRIMDLIQSRLKSLGLETNKERLKALLGEGRIYLLLDGLNDVSPEDYASCVAETRSLLRDFPKICFVLSDRPSDHGRLQPPVLELDEWDDDQIEGYVKAALRQLGNTREAWPLIDQIQHEKNENSAATLPLFLGMAAVTYHSTGQIVTERAQLCYSYARVLLERDHEYSGDTTRLQKLLADLAFEATRHDWTGFPESFVLERIAGLVQSGTWPGQNGVEENGITFLERLKQEGWLMGTGSNRLRFSLDIFRDIFASIRLKERFDLGDELDEFILDVRWEEPIILLAGLLDDRAGRLIQRIQEKAGVDLAARCLINAPRASGRERVIQQLREELTSTLEARRQRAAGLFIFLHDRQSISELTQALADPDDQVRWKAALAIQKTLGKKASDEIFINILESSRSTPEMVNCACVALSRSESQEAARALINALTNPQEHVRRRAGIALTYLRSPQALILLEEAIRRNVSPGIVAGAMLALSFTRPDMARELAVHLVDHPEIEVRDEAYQVLVRLRDAKILNHYQTLLETGTPGQRRKVIAALGEARIEAAIDPLWKLLSDRRFGVEARRALVHIGGQDVIERARQEFDHPDPTIRRSAIGILGRIKDNQCIELLVSAMDEQDTDILNMIVDLLGGFGGRAVPALERELLDAKKKQSERQVRAILHALKNIGSPAAIQIISETLEDPRTWVSMAALEYLRQVDQESTRLVLRELWPGASDEHRTQISELLLEIENQHKMKLALDYYQRHDPAILREIFEDAHSPISIIQTCAVIALGRTGADETLPELREFSESGSPELRAFAVYAIGHLDIELDITLDSQLADWMNDDRQPLKLRLACAQTLGELGDKKERGILAQARAGAPARLSDEIDLAIATIERRLKASGPVPASQQSSSARIQTLLEQLKNPVDAKRIAAVEELAVLHHPRVDLLLIEALRDRNPKMCITALQGIGRRRAAGAVPQIARLLSNENAGVRRAAIRALGDIGSSEAMQSLRAIATEVEPDLRTEGLEILTQSIEEPAAFNTLCTFLGFSEPGYHEQTVKILGQLPAHRMTQAHLDIIESTLTSQNPFVRSGLLTALGNIQAEVSIPILSRYANDSKFFVRLAAIQGLARFHDPRVIEVLGQALFDRAPDIRYEAAKGLRQSRTSEGLSLLRRLDRETSPGVIDEALKAGEEAPGVLGIALLERFVEHNLPEVRIRAIEALKHKDTLRAGEALLPAITDTRPRQRAARLRAIQVAGELKVQKAAASLVRLVVHPDPGLREAAANALEEIGPQVVATHLIRILENPDPNVAAIAAHLLGQLHDEQMMDELIEQLHNEGQVRLAAIQALADLGQPAAAGPLANLAKSARDKQVRLAAVKALGCLTHPTSASALVWALTHPDPDTREVAKGALELTQAPIGPDLLPVLDHFSARTRQTAAYLLGRHKVPAAIPRLYQALHDRNSYVASEAAIALGNIGTAEATATLVKAMEQGLDNRYVAQAAVKALSKIGGFEVIQGLSAAIHSPYAEVRCDAVQALCTTPEPQAGIALTGFLRQEGDDQVVQAFLDVLEREQGETAAVGLAYFLEHGDHPQAVRAAETLRRNGSPLAIQALMKAMAFKDQNVRVIAIRAMGEHDVAAAIPCLLGALKRSQAQDTPTRQAAEQALIQLHSRDSVPELVHLLKHRNPLIVQAACRILSSLQATEAVLPLTGLLENANASTRQAAGEALRALGQKSFEES